MRILIGAGTCGLSAGAMQVKNTLEKLLAGSDYAIEETGCTGMCFREVLVDIIDGRGARLYGNITPEKAEILVKEDIEQGRVLKEWLADREEYFRLQTRIALRNCGHIVPSRMDDYMTNRGYEAISGILKNGRSPLSVVEEIEKSGLRGRGGGGFPTGRKWKAVYGSPGPEKYFICNGDEGDPGAFMDRSILEGDPHSVIEGMLIGAYAIGAGRGYVYVRAEYPLAVHRMKGAIEEARSGGFLGENILGSGFSFDISVKEGAGAFVCGEETALIASMEGNRGMPRYRPPYPAEKGLRDKPTCINNVETLANVPWILLNGWEKFASVGTETSKGTKVFATAGKIRNSGLVEIAMGTPLSRIVYEIGGGVKDGRALKAVQLGGPSGGCIPHNMLDIPVDYEKITSTGAIVGSGGMILMDDTTCMVEVARFFLSFTNDESCGKCTFCRVGSKRMLEILENITRGKAVEGDLERLEELALEIKRSSLCGLGQSAPNPVITTIRYFRDEYTEHIRNRRCPALYCRDLITYSVNPKSCVGCGACKKICPTGAASGEKRKTHRIDQKLCVKCGKCYEVCKFGAIDRA